MATPPCPAAAAPAGPVSPRLTNLIPARAQGALVLRREFLSVMEKWMVSDQAAKKELSSYLNGTVGVDLTEVQGVVGFVETIEPPSMAVLLVLPAPGILKGKPMQDGTVLLAKKPKITLVAARHPQGVVVGTPGAVQGALAVAESKAPSAAEGGALAPLLKADGDDVAALAVVNASTLPPEAQAATRRFGVSSATLIADADRTIKLRVAGERRGLAALRQLVMAQATRGLQALEQRKATTKALGDVSAAVSAISGYHMARAVFEEAQPRLVEGALVSQYQIPGGDGTVGPTSIAVVGILAAVAIPSFIKYLRKAKTVEATESLDKIAAGARLFYSADHYDQRGRVLPKQFPGSVDWTPRAGCCGGAAGSKCAPADTDWQAPTWRKLHFVMRDPHYYQYRFSSKGQGRKAVFEVEARGDLDCDGEFSSYKMMGSVNASGEVEIKGPLISNEIE